MRLLYMLHKWHSFLTKLDPEMFYLLVAFQEFSEILLKYFNGTTISTFATPFLLVLFVSLDLNINELVSLMLLFGLSLQYYHKLADAFE